MGDQENVQEASHNEYIENLYDSDEANLEDDYFHQFIDVTPGPQGSGSQNVLQIVAVPAVLDENNGDLLSELEDDELYEDYACDEDENKVIKCHYKYNPIEMCKDFQFSLGMEFTSIKQFKDALKEHSLLNGYVYDYIKNDKERCRVKCKSKCGWLMYVSKERDSSTYRLKTMNPKHACGVTIDATRASSVWIAEKIVDSVRMNKNMKLSDVQSIIRKDYMAKPSLNKAFWARKPSTNKVRRSNTSVTCKICKNPGHNRRTCPQPIRESRNQHSQDTVQVTPPSTNQPECSQS